MFDVGFVCERCPDGVEIHDYGEAQPVGETAVSDALLTLLVPKAPSWRRGLYYRARSERRANVPVNSVDLEDPLVLRFINARTAEATAAFFGAYGMLSGAAEDELDFIARFKEIFSGIIESISDIPDGMRAERINSLLRSADLRAEFDYSGPGQSGRMVFYAQKLATFMACEVATAVIRNVGVVRCANCEQAFFTGPAAKRRSDAKTCSERCRSALRRRNAIAQA